MARVSYLSVEDLAPEYQDMPRMKSNITRALAHSPRGARHKAGLGMYLRHESRLEPRLRELAILQVGYTTGSEYEYAHHVDVALSFGVSEADILAIAHDSAGRASSLDPVARAVLQAAREMTEQLRLSDACFAVLNAALDAEALIDLLIAIGEYNGMVRIMAALEVDLEPEFQAYLERFPLPVRAAAGDHR
ncbi:carboxymuconolactone decarboxylase family protein [Massilia sp. DWR3-1-1]|uniref:carboxymuconolactone decarboxylase family protein n=1 Tax=Massilia sp. DWR3-1-1 TaxID=2804559 RepID=UPI003CF229D0